MNRRVERGLDAVLARSPAQPLSLWRASRKLTVLAYHGVEDGVRFTEQLDYLVHALHPVSLDQVLEALHRGRGLPDRAALITFDDGERSVLEVAMPLLRDRGIPGLVFVVAGLLDTDDPAWWVEAESLLGRGGSTALGAGPAEILGAMKRRPDEERLAMLAELRQTASTTAPAVPQLRRAELPVLESAGMAIGNHTLTHPILIQCPEERVIQEIEEAHRILAHALGQPPKAFTYPDGAADPRAITTLRALGYEAAFLFDHRVSDLPPADPLRISRVRVNALDSLDRFRISVSGLHPALHHGLGKP